MIVVVTDGLTVAVDEFKKQQQRGMGGANSVSSFGKLFLEAPGA